VDRYGYSCNHTWKPTEVINCTLNREYHIILCCAHCFKKEERTFWEKDLLYLDIQSLRSQATKFIKEYEWTDDFGMTRYKYRSECDERLFNQLVLKKIISEEIEDLDWSWL
jgi:hypothetical protein